MENRIGLPCFNTVGSLDAIPFVGLSGGPCIIQFKNFNFTEHKSIWEIMIKNTNKVDKSAVERSMTDPWFKKVY